MNDRTMRILTLALAIAFAVSPWLSSGFGGFYRESFPVQAARWPAQPAGWAFSIWGVIYLGLILMTAWTIVRPRETPGWPRVARPLGGSLLIGAFWIEAATRAPLLATAMILPMAGLAILAMLRAGADGRVTAPLGLYAGWLTAAAGVAVSVVLTGHGVLPAGAAAILLVAAVLVVALAVAAARPRIWSYRLGVGWALFGIIAANLGAGDWTMVALGALGIAALAGFDRLRPRAAA